MEFFLPFPYPWSRNLFYNIFLNWSKRFKNNFQNRKWNYPNRKWNYFSHFLASNAKTSLTKHFSFDPKVSKLIFKTGNGIIQTGNGIISPTFWPPMKKLLLQNIFHLIQGFQKLISKIGNGIIQSGNGILQTGNGIISPTSRLLMKKLLLQHIFYLFQSFQNWFSKQETELSKQEMELFLPSDKKKVFYKMLLICSKGFKINYYATKIVVPLKSDHEIKDQILVHQVPTSHGFKRRIDSQSQHQTMFSESFKIDYTLKSGHKNAFVVYLYISLRIVISIHSFLTTLINKMKLMITYFRKKKQL